MNIIWKDFLYRGATAPIIRDDSTGWRGITNMHPGCRAGVMPWRKL